MPFCLKVCIRKWFVWMFLQFNSFNTSLQRSLTLLPKGSTVRVSMRLRRLLLIITLLLAPFFFLGSTVFGADHPKPIKVGVYDNKPKVYLDENNTPAGLFPAIVNFIAEQEGWQIQYVFGTWEQGLARLKTNEIDVMVDMAYSAEREQDYIFTKETVFNSWGVIYVNRKSKISTLIDLAGKRIAILKSSIYYGGPQGADTFLKALNIQASYQLVDTQSDVFDLLEQEQVDAGIVSRVFALGNANAYPDIRATDMVFSPTELRFALSKGNPDSLSIAQRIDAQVRKLKDGERAVYEKILDRYSLVDTVVIRKVLPEWFYYAVGGFIVITVLLLTIIIMTTRAGTIFFGRLRKNEEFYRALVSAAGESGIGLVILQNLRGRDAAVVYFNDRALALSGYSRDELSALSLKDIVPSDLVKQLSENYTARQQGAHIPSFYETAFLTKSGTRVPITIGVSVAEYKGKQSTIIFFQDITRMKDTQTQLENLLERQKAMLAAIPDIIMEVNKDKIYTWANQAGFEFFGPDVVGKEASSYFKGNQLTYEVVKPLFAGAEDVFYVESWQRRKDGKKRLLAWWCRVIKDADGNPIGALSSARDITDSKKLKETAERRSKELEAEKNKGDAILQSIGECLFVTNGAGQVVLVNKAFEETLGWKSSEIRGKKFTDLIPIQDSDGNTIPAEKCPITIALDRGENYASEINGPTHFLVRRDGTRFPILCQVTLLKENPNIIGAIAIFHDISKEKEIDQMKTDFLSIAAHQLRTPLGAMRWNLEMLLGGDMGEIPADIKTTVAQIYDCNKRLIGLVNDLLNVSRIEQGRVLDAPTTINPVIVAKENVDELEVLAKQRGISLHFESDGDIPDIIIDKTRLHEVIENLLSNGIKYNSKNGRVRLHMKRDGDYILISVASTGKPIDPTDQHRIFSKFFRSADAMKNETSGSGLGLFLVKSYVDGWGGKIWFQSPNPSETTGTTFYIQLPVHPISSNEKTKS